MNIKITADSTCDLSPALIAAFNITIMPLTVVKDGENYRDGIEITPADIFAHVAAGGALCSTAAVNVGEYRALFEPLATQYDAVIHINIGAGFSSCYQNACIAAEEFSNVHIIDSKNLSTGQGLVVLEAARRAADCADVDALCDHLRALTGRVESSFLLDKLEYMAKGGRCSSVMALGANLLKLKPCIAVIDGKMQVYKKYRGKFDKCVAEYVRERLENRDDIVRHTLFITHSPVTPDAMTAATEAAASYGNFDEVFDTDAGCTVSCHCGPGTLGVLFVRKEP